MTAHSLAITRIAIAYRDRDEAQRRYDAAKARGDTKAMARALLRLQDATLRALKAEAGL